MDDQLLRRLDRLEARAHIAELGMAYCIACDDRDMPRLRSLFTDDIVIDTPNGSMRAHGIEDVMALYGRLFAIRGPSCHWTHDRTISFDEADPDLASGQVLAHAETTPGGIAAVAAMRYDDAYRRVHGRWLFARRALSFVYYVPVAEYASRLSSPLRFHAQGQWSAADLPEGSKAWRDYHDGARPVSA